MSSVPDFLVGKLYVPPSLLHHSATINSANFVKSFSLLPIPEYKSGIKQLIIISINSSSENLFISLFTSSTTEEISTGFSLPVGYFASTMFLK